MKTLVIFSAIAFLFGSGPPLRAQSVDQPQTLIIPAALANQYGSDGVEPFPGSVQFQYGASEFSGVGTGPVAVTSVSFRVDEATRSNPSLGIVIPPLTMYVAVQSGDRSPGGFFNFMKESIVYERSVAATIPLPNGTEFGVTFPFTTPYVYDPKEGNLLVGILAPQGPAGLLRYLDAERSADGLYLVAKAGGTVESVPVVVAASFGYFSVPEPCMWSLALLGVFIWAAKRRFQ